MGGQIMKMTKKEKLTSVALILILGLVVSRIAYFYRTPYGSTPEKAISIYLGANTSSFRILEEKKDSAFNLNSTRYVVTADCKYNWRGSNQGRVDGVNTFFFDLKRSKIGWYVVSANSGP